MSDVQKNELFLQTEVTVTGMFLSNQSQNDKV